ncbi:exosortase Y [Mucilaginibacter antarcticus]|uniref:Exosortase Y n=2 Tax=Mucilaginibacter antarcticus TaxID=1855725 RepID=A0ABW5XKS4_9SPHI
MKFAAWFVSLFVVFYYSNILFLGITSPGKYYSPFLAQHLNYIQGLRWVLLKSSAGILNSLGYYTITNTYDLLVAGHGIIRLAYDCLGLGVISFFTAFVLAYPKPPRAKLVFIITGIVAIQLLNIARFVLLALFWTRGDSEVVDHHTLFNMLMYVIISISLYFWVKTDIAPKRQHAAN